MNYCLVNVSRQAALAERMIIADTFLQRLQGLLGRSAISFPAGRALALMPCRQVHSWFMRFSIDLLFVDHRHRVVKTILDFQPFRVSPLVKEAEMVIELPQGMVNSSGTLVGDRLEYYIGRAENEIAW